MSETRKQSATEDSDVNFTLHIYKKTKLGWQDFCLLSGPGVLQQEERGNKVDFKRAGGSHTLSQPYTLHNDKCSNVWQVLRRLQKKAVFFHT